MPKRRERSTAQLHGALTRVNEEVNLGSTSSQQASAPWRKMDEGGLNSPAKQVKTQSLRFPRNAPDAAADEGSSSQARLDTYGASSSRTASTCATADQNEQLEELRLQNAVLRKSLAMLQQSVVESMKGNKAGFVGNGYFKQRGGPSNAQQHVVDHQEAADLESLRNRLAEQRAAVRKAIEERDEANQDAKGARLEVAELSRRNRELELKLQAAQEASRTAEAAQAQAESEAAKAREQTAALETSVEELNRQVAAARSDLAEAAREAEARHSSLEEQLRAAQEANWKACIVCLVIG